MNIQKYKNYNSKDDNIFSGLQKKLINIAEEKSKVAREKDKRLMEYVNDLEQDGKDGITDRYTWTKPFDYFVGKTFNQTLPAYIIRILSLFLYIPMTLIWLLGEILKICFVWTPFYDYFVYYYGCIYSGLIKLFSDIFIYTHVLEEIFIDKDEIKLLYQESEQFANYSVWELFYKK